MNTQNRTFGHAVLANCENVIYFSEVVDSIDYANDLAECDRQAEARQHSGVWSLQLLDSDPYFKPYGAADYPDMPCLRVVGAFDPDWAA